MNNRGINENNLNILDEELGHYLSDQETNNPIGIDFHSKEQEMLLSQLKAQVVQLKNCLDEKNKEIIEAERQSNSIKIDYVKLQEQFLLKENLISELSNLNSKLKLDNASLKLEKDELKTQSIALNHQIIALNQRVSSVEIQNNFKKQLDSIEKTTTNNKPSTILFEKEKQYEIELSKLHNDIDEMQITKAKLSFENKTLKIHVEELQSDKDNEIQMNKSFYDKTIDNHKKTIAGLQKQISDMCQKETNKMNEYSCQSIHKQSLSNQTLMIQLDEIEAKAKAFDSENYIISKKIQFYKDEIEEYKIKMQNKDKIIAKLQKDLDDFVYQYKTKVDTGDTTTLIQLKEKEDLLQKNEALMIDIANLTNQNKELKIGLQEMSQGLNETNYMVKNKMNTYEIDLNKEKEKNIGYKAKIRNLKIKIDELYAELDIYRQQQQYDEQNQRLNTESSVSRRDNINNAPSIEIVDPFEPSQRKTIDDYKMILQKVDTSLQKYKEMATTIEIVKVNNTISLPNLN